MTEKIKVKVLPVNTIQPLKDFLRSFEGPKESQFEFIQYTTPSEIWDLESFTPTGNFRHIDAYISEITSDRFICRVEKELTEEQKINLKKAFFETFDILANTSIRICVG